MTCFFDPTQVHILKYGSSHEKGFCALVISAFTHLSICFHVILKFTPAVGELGKEKHFAFVTVQLWCLSSFHGFAATDENTELADRNCGSQTPCDWIWLNYLTQLTGLFSFFFFFFLICSWSHCLWSDCARGREAWLSHQEKPGSPDCWAQDMGGIPEGGIAGS